MENQKFVGPKKVLMVSIDELKTYGGNEVVTVKYENGETELMPKRSYELVATDEPSDYTTVRNKKSAELRKDLYPIVSTAVSSIGESEEARKASRTVMLQKVLAAISEIDMKDSEVQPFFDQMLVEMNGIINAILYEISTAMGRAINYLWTKDDSLFVPGTDVMQDRTYLEAKKIVADIPPRAKTDEGEPSK